MRNPTNEYVRVEINDSYRVNRIGDYIFAFSGQFLDGKLSEKSIRFHCDCVDGDSEEYVNSFNYSPNKGGNTEFLGMSLDQVKADLEYKYHQDKADAAKMLIIEMEKAQKEAA